MSGSSDPCAQERENALVYLHLGPTSITMGGRLLENERTQCDPYGVFWSAAEWLSRRSSPYGCPPFPAARR